MNKNALMAGAAFLALLDLNQGAVAQTPPSGGGGGPVNIGSVGGTAVSGGALPVTGTFSATISGFTPNGSFSTLVATGTSSSVALPTGTTVKLQNTGSTAVSCNLGVGSATATVNQNIIQPLGQIVLTPGSNTFGACIDVSGTVSNTIVIAGGSGLGNDTGGGGGGGGSGGNVNINQINGSAFAGTNLPVLAVPFAPNGTVAALSTVTATSAAFSLPTNGGEVAFANEGTLPVYIHLGPGTTAATAADFMLQAGAVIGLGVINNGTTAVYANMISTGTVIVGMQGGAGTLNGPGGASATAANQGSEIAQLTTIANAVTTSIPAGTNFIGFTLDALNSGWVSGTSAATRVALVNTGTAAGTLVTAYASLKGEIVDLICFRQDAGTTTAWITFNDSVSTQIVLPVGGGASPPIRVPIKSTGTNTPITFTNSQSIAVSCNAGVYGGT